MNNPQLQSNKLLSIVVPMKDNFEMTVKCIRSLIDNTSNLGEIIIIDDHSDKDFLRFLNNNYPSLLLDINFYINNDWGVNSAWNYGASLSKCPYIAWVNNDILFSPDWDTPLINAFNNDIWVVSPYHTAGELPIDFPQGKSRKSNMEGNQTGLTFLGSCFMMKKENWERVGPIDERLKLWSGDNYIFESVVNDFGRQCIEVPESYIHHFVSQTIDREKIKDILEQDEKNFYTIYHDERQWDNRKTYPWILKEIDLRLKLPVKDMHKLNVLNIGVGDMVSGVARQLPFYLYKGLVDIDVHKPYLDCGMNDEWMYKESISFVKMDARDIILEGVDLVMIFDVLEHLPKEDSILFVKYLMDRGVKLLIFGPLENRLHNHRLDEEVESQKHLSLWTAQDFKDLGLKTEVIKDFHIEDDEMFDAIWAWNY